MICSVALRLSRLFPQVVRWIVTGVTGGIELIGLYKGDSW